MAPEGERTLEIGDRRATMAGRKKNQAASPALDRSPSQFIHPASHTIRARQGQGTAKQPSHPFSSFSPFHSTNLQNSPPTTRIWSSLQVRRGTAFRYHSTQQRHRRG